MKSPHAVAFCIALSLGLGASWAQEERRQDLDLLDERLRIPDSELFDDGQYIDSGVGLVFGIDKRLTYYAGQYEDAAAGFEVGVRGYPYKAEIWVFLARAYFYMKSPERARETLERARQVMPDLEERLWGPLVDSLLSVIRQRASEQQIRVDFYSPGQDEFLSVFRLYLFLEDHELAAGVVRSATARGVKMIQMATTVSGSSRRSYLDEAARWHALAGDMAAELETLGTPVDPLAQSGTSTSGDAAIDMEAEEIRILQLKIDFYRATEADYRKLFDLYQQRDDGEKSAGVLAAVEKEIGRLQLQASVAPTIQAETDVLDRMDKFTELQKELKTQLPQAAEAP